MDWYFKGGLIVGLIWGAARALGVYGEQARDLDINFVYGFLLTTGETIQFPSDSRQDPADV